jgi:hypothetical protein
MYPASVRFRVLPAVPVIPDAAVFCFTLTPLALRERRA